MKKENQVEQLTGSGGKRGGAVLWQIAKPVIVTCISKGVCALLKPYAVKLMVLVVCGALAERIVDMPGFCPKEVAAVCELQQHDL